VTAVVGRGVLLASRYRVGEAIGRGGMSMVYHGYDELLRRDVAIKVLIARAPDTRGSRQEFLGEARAAAALVHPNIAGIYDVGVYGAERYIVMEYVPGGSLMDLVQTEAPIAPDRAVKLATQIADALDYGHRHGIVHCDVKPQNVLLDETGRPKLVDFGISRTLSATGALTDTITGTAGYIAPEQLLGERLDGRADIYSLGCVVYELLTGALPFQASNLAALATQRLTREPTPLRQRNPHVSAALAESVMRALERDREQRYHSAAEFSQALAACLSLSGPTARPTARAGTAELGRHAVQTAVAGRAVASDRSRGQGARLWPLALLLLAVLIASGAVAAAELPALFTSGSSAVGVPAVGNLSAQDAVRELHARHLAVSITLQDTSGTPACTGTVLSQNPPPNAQVKPGSTVTLLVGQNSLC
jgi:predicted Ser/Thr protein kinase